MASVGSGGELAVSTSGVGTARFFYQIFDDRKESGGFLRRQGFDQFGQPWGQTLKKAEKLLIAGWAAGGCLDGIQI